MYNFDTCGWMYFKGVKDLMLQVSKLSTERETAFSKKTETKKKSEKRECTRECG